MRSSGPGFLGAQPPPLSLCLEPCRQPQPPRCPPHSPFKDPAVGPSHGGLAGAPSVQLLCKIGFSFSRSERMVVLGERKGPFCVRAGRPPAPARVRALLLLLPSPPNSPVGCPRGRLAVGGGPDGHQLGRTGLRTAGTLAAPPRSGWAAGPDLPGGHGGGCPRPGNGFWAGGIYRLLFTKTRPVKHFTAASYKGTAVVAEALPRTPAPAPRLPAWPARGCCQGLQELSVIWAAAVPHAAPLTDQAWQAGLRAPSPASAGGLKGTGRGGGWHPSRALG